MAGEGVTTLCPGATGQVNPPRGSVALRQRTVLNEGTLVWTSGSVLGSRGARLINRGLIRANSESGRMEFAGDGMIPLLHNHGTIRKDSGSGITGIDFGLSPRGGVIVDTGSLVFGGSFNARLAKVDGSGENPETPEDVLMPDGQPIGSPGTDETIREVPGGAEAAEDIFFRLARGGTDITPEGHNGILVSLPGGGHVGIRPQSKSGDPAVDVNLPGIPFEKMHFGH